MKNNVMIMTKGEAKSVVQHWVSRIINEAEFEWNQPDMCQSGRSHWVWLTGCNKIQSLIDAELITKDDVNEMFDKEREKVL